MTHRAPRHNPIVGFLAASLVAATFGCGPSGARSPNPVVAIDEARAVTIIAKVLTDEGLQATEARPIVLSGNVEVKLDVGVSDRKLGIIYFTAADAQELDNYRFSTPPEGPELTIRVGIGPDAGMRVLFLFASDYAYDDNVGTGRESPSKTAENKLARDVRDFAIFARKNRWP